MAFPKTEPHVHLEGTARAATLPQSAGRGGVPSPGEAACPRRARRRALAGQPGRGLAAMDYAAASQLGVSARDYYQAGLRGPPCGQRTRRAAAGR